MTADLTAAEVAALRALLRQATQPPWTWESTGEKDNSWCIGVTEPPVAGQIAEWFNEDTGTFSDHPEVVEFVAQSGSTGFADAALIVAAVNALPALLDAAERVAAAELSPGRCPRCKETLIRVDPDGDEARRLEMLNAKGG